MYKMRYYLSLLLRVTFILLILVMLLMLYLISF